MLARSSLFGVASKPLAGATNKIEGWRLSLAFFYARLFLRASSSLDIILPLLKGDQLRESRTRSLAHAADRSGESIFLPGLG